MNSTATALQIADAYLTSRNYRQAEDVLGTALATDPENPRLLTTLARVKLEQSDYVAAEAAVAAALAGNPGDETALVVHSRALEELDRVPEALDAARRAAELYPHSTYSLYRYARLLGDADQTDDAMTVAEEALRLDPLDADLHCLRGHINSLRAEIDAAEADFHEALRLDPEHAESLEHIAILRFVRFRRWSAIDHLLGAARIVPADSDSIIETIGFVLTRVLRRASWFTLIVAIAVIVAFVRHAAGESTVWPRVVAGVWSFFLLVTYARVMKHQLPREVRKAVVRQRKLLSVRIVMLHAGLVFGFSTAIVGPGLISTAFSVLLIPALVLTTIVGRVRDERLW